MTLYTPFMKLKKNEIQGMCAVGRGFVEWATPLFDIPRSSKLMTEADIDKRLRLGLTDLEKAAERHEGLSFFLDNYDLDDTILIGGQPQYAAILDHFSHLRAIAVVALDRIVDHNNAALAFARRTTAEVALRLTPANIESFAYTEDELASLVNRATKADVAIHLMLDMRHMASGGSIPAAVQFLSKALSRYAFSSVRCTGSSIPANISDLLKTNSKIEVDRVELQLWLALKNAGHTQVTFGDYGIVSPDYSDAELQPWLLRQVSTPKAFYCFDDRLYATRGSSLETHPLGNGQFFGLADDIVAHRGFRGRPYSDGDKYIFDRSLASNNKPLKAGSQGSWTKAMTTAHLTFMINRLGGPPL